MKILSINAGSSSLKFSLYEMPEEKVLVSGNIEEIGTSNSGYTIKKQDEKIKNQVEINNHEEAVEILLHELINQKIIENYDEIKGVGHRVVHGGEKYTQTVVIDAGVLEDMESILDLAPLHNAASLKGMKAFLKVLPNTLNTIVFDTAFHQTLKKEEYIYAVPYEWYKKYGIRKYGFHGTSHRYIANRISEILGKKELKIISCHLGNGASICAIKNGESIDTSMGFTPLAGIPMGTRSGDIDPSIIEYVMKKTGESIEEITKDLNKKSGFLGISGKTSDNREIEKLIAEGDERAKLAMDIYARRVTDYISAYNTLLEGADVICFAAGLGENGIHVRETIMKRLKTIGVEYSEVANNIRGKDACITAEESKMPCYVIATNEEIMIARDTYSFIK